LELLGARDWGLRVTIKLQDVPGVLAELTGAISNHGGNIVALGTFWGDDPTTGEIVVKVQRLDVETMEEIVEDMDAEIVDVREIQI
jgi:acetoin utilization protein AcuB